MLGNSPLKPCPRLMVMSAMVNLLADSGTVPSWSSAWASVAKANAYRLRDRYLKLRPKATPPKLLKEAKRRNSIPRLTL
eukprot:286542-Amphidinium_carterae.1